VILKTTSPPFLEFDLTVALVCNFLGVSLSDGILTAIKFLFSLFA